MQAISVLNSNQKNELDRRMKLFNSGKIKRYKWSEVYKELKNERKTKSS